MDLSVIKKLKGYFFPCYMQGKWCDQQRSSHSWCSSSGRPKNVFQNNLKMFFIISSHWPIPIPLFVLGLLHVFGCLTLLPCLGRCAFSLQFSSLVSPVCLHHFCVLVFWTVKRTVPVPCSYLPFFYRDCRVTVTGTEIRQHPQQQSAPSKNTWKTVKFWSVSFCNTYITGQSSAQI